MNENLFIFIQNVFNIKNIIDKKYTKRTDKTKYLDILNKKIYNNRDIIMEEINLKNLNAKTYWELKNKISHINTNIDIVKLSQMIYRKEDINNFQSSIKLL